MTAEERKLLSDILVTLHHVSYTALIEIKKEQRSNPNDIKVLEGNKEALGDMIERFRNL